MKASIMYRINQFAAVFILLWLGLPGQMVFGQVQDVPHPDKSEPLALDDPAEFVTFIVLPLLLILLFIWLRRRRRR